MMELQKPDNHARTFSPQPEVLAVASGINAAEQMDSAGFDGALLRAGRSDDPRARTEACEAETAALTSGQHAESSAARDAGDSAALPASAAVKDSEKQASIHRLHEEAAEPRELLDALLAAAQSPLPPMQMLTSGAPTIAVQMNAALRGIGASAAGIRAEAVPQAANARTLLDRVNGGANLTGGNSAAESVLPQAGAEPASVNRHTPPFIGQTAAFQGSASATADLAPAGAGASPRSLSARPVAAQINTASSAAIVSIPEGEPAPVRPGAAILPAAASDSLPLSPLSAGLTAAGAGAGAYPALAQAGAAISLQAASEPAQPGQLASVARAAGAGADLLVKQAGSEALPPAENRQPQPGQTATTPREAEISLRPANAQIQAGQIASAPANLLTGQAGAEILLRSANGEPAASVAVVSASGSRADAAPVLPGVELAARGSNGQPLAGQLPDAGDKAGVNAAAGSAPTPQGASVNSAPGTAGAAAAASLLPGAEPQSRTPDVPLTAARASAAHHGVQTNPAQPQPQPDAALPAAMAAAPRALTQAAALREAVRDELPARMSALLPTSSAAEGAVAPLHAARQVGAAAAAQPEAAAAPVMTARPAPDVSPWAQQLKSALGERLQIQLKNQIQHATIRLDPPEMGKIDIALKLDGGRMQVHISAGQADVYRALQQTSGELRQMLVGHHVDQVTVQVSAQSGQQQQGRGHAAGEPPQTAIAAAAEMADAGASGLRQQDDSVLLTV